MLKNPMPGGVRSSPRKLSGRKVSPEEDAWQIQASLEAVTASKNNKPKLSSGVWYLGGCTGPGPTTMRLTDTGIRSSVRAQDTPLWGDAGLQDHLLLEIYTQKNPKSEDGREL